MVMTLPSRRAFSPNGSCYLPADIYFCTVKKGGLSIFFLCCTCLCLHALKQPFFQLLGKAQGLPAQTVYSLAEDSLGRLLLGTDKGLFRYNGIGFTELSCPGASSKALANIVQLGPDLYLAHNFNGELFCLQGGKLQQLQVPGLPEEISTLRVKGDSLLLVSIRKVQLYNWRKGTLLHTYRGPAEKKGHFFSAAFIGGRVALLGTDGHIYIDGRLEMQTTHNLAEIIELDRGLLLVPLFGSEILEYRNGEYTVWAKMPFRNNSKIHGACRIGTYLFVYSQEGVFRYDVHTRKADHWFRDYKITAVWKDRRGHFWFSTLEKGLLFVPNIEVSVLSGETVLSVTRYQGETYAGDNYGSVYRIGDDGQVLRTYRPRFSIIEAGLADVREGLLRTNTSVFDIRSGRQINTRFEFLKHFAADDSGGFYLAKPYGLLHVSRKNIPFPGAEYGITDARKVTFLAEKRTRSVSRSADGAVAAALIDGLWCWKNGVRSELRYRDKPVKASGLHFEKDILFVNTYNEGVLLFRRGELLGVVDMKNGLKSNHILRTVYRPEGLYILTDEDFYQMKRGTGFCRPLKSVFGFLSLQVNDLCIDAGRYYLATDIGVLSAPLRDAEPEKPELLIRGIGTNGNTAAAGGQVKLPHAANDIQLFFEAVSYKNAASLHYRCRLERNGTGSRWMRLPVSATSVSFPNLKAGEYRFRIQAVDTLSGTCSPERTADFRIEKPWYTSLPAILVYLSAVVLLSSFFWWLRGFYISKKYRRQVARQQLMKELAEARLTALRAQMNPHFMYNVLNSIQSLVYAHKHNEASYYLGRYADLTRRFLELSSRERVSIREECDTLRIYLELEKLRFGGDFSYSIETGPEIDAGYDTIPTLLVQPFAENAIKHGLLHKTGEKQLNIRFDRYARGIAIHICDNGVGRRKSAEINARKAEHRSSYATGAVLKKIELLNRDRSHRIEMKICDLYAAPDLPSGTEVSIHIPDENEMHSC